MPAPPEDKPDSGELPDPELSPTLNPTLGRNLGRWAQVYFTNPPEKREQAVQELLRELQAPPRAQQGSRVPVSNESRKEASASYPEEEARICPACLHKNGIGQRFCGLCGFPLASEAGSKVEKKESHIATTAVPAPTERNPEDWQWLREKHVTEFANTQERGHSWVYIAAVLVVFAVAAFFLWHNHGRLSGTEETANVQARGETGQPVTKPELQKKQAETSSQTNAAPDSPAPGSKAESEDTKLHPSTSATSQSDNGARELLLGRRFLVGQGVPKEHSVAAIWLWKAVAKQNPDAVLLLSDLYLRGDGVPQSCDQARVLLRAAAGRGSSEAQAKLNSTAITGCK